VTVFPSFYDKDRLSLEVAKMLLEINAVHFYKDKPFFLTSGLASPVYIDCRKIISYPRLRSTLIDFAMTVIINEIGYESIDSVVGGETAGIPFASWISDRLMLPMQYVRKKAKGFGRNAQVEGKVTVGARALLVEDLSTDCKSKVNFCQAMRVAGLEVSHCFVIFYYNIFQKSFELMQELGINLHYLSTWQSILKVAKEGKYFEFNNLNEIENFLHEPDKWSVAHDGSSNFI
jgi:orotate phosphoribosyltransferase